MDFMKSAKKSWNVVLTAALVAAVTLGLGACSTMDSDASDRTNMTRTKAQSGPGWHNHRMMATVESIDGDAIELETKTGIENAQLDQDVWAAAERLDEGDKVIVNYQHTNDVLLVTAIRKATATDMDRDWETQVDWDDRTM